VEIVFDPAKDEANRAKHGLSLAFGARILADPNRVILPSIRPIDGEDRYKVLGEVEGKLYTGVHVVRDGSLRFMSVRRSNDGEERIYRRP
jgi:uncharacterized DUF497 family protein